MQCRVAWMSDCREKQAGEERSCHAWRPGTDKFSGNRRWYADAVNERRIMDVSPIGRTDLSGSATAKQPDPAESDSRRNAFIAAHQLNNLDIADREFSVVRDPESHRFVVVVVERSTGTVLDQFPPENILRMLSQVSSGNSKQTGETSE
jgi:hypothetical protein